MTKEKNKDHIGSVKIKHKWLWIWLLILFVLGSAAIACVNIYANALNITEIGEKYLSVYIKDIKLGILCYSLAFILSMLLFSATSIILKRNLLKWEETATFLKSKTVFFILNGVFSFITAYSLPYNIPRSVMLATNPTWFVHADPVFGKNIGYYVFQRPLFVDLSNWALILLFVILIYALTIYFMYYARNGAGGLKVFAQQPQIVAHICAIVLTGYIISGFTSVFSAEYLMLDNTLTESQGGFTDIMIWSNFYKFVPFMVAVIIILTVIFMIKKRTKYMLCSMLVYPAAWLLVAIYALGVQSFYVNPNKATIERPYTKYRIESTLRAYGLDGVDEVTYPLTGKITAESVTDNLSQLESVILTDGQTALNILNQRPDSKQFYLFKNADLVPDYSGENLKASYTAAQEIFIPDDNQTLNEYNNRKMRYTHGFGMGTVSVQDSPASQPQKLSQPRIYFGESEKDFKEDYIITGTTIGEYDAESESENSGYKYDGPAGVSLNLFNRIIYAFRYQDPSILFSGNITSHSKILFNRNVTERARIALPFLTYDDDPYLVQTKDGRLVWILEGYTSTNSFPYAVKLYDLDEDFGTNYIRNSVKITVDAYTGEVKAYIIDWDDPIIRTLSNIYPEVFLTGSLPDEIASHLRYPKKLFEMQSNIYKTYHDTNPATFYTRDNAWEYAMSKSGEASTVKSLTPYYQIIDSGNKAPKLSLISAFTPAGNSEHLTALFTASSDINSYGELTLYTFPKNTHVFGTMQTENRIESDPAISEEIEKLSSEGPVVFGPLTTLPLMDTICYVKPVYVNSGALQLKRVIVGCGESIAIDVNLSGAFKKLAVMNPKSDYSFEVESKPQEDEEYTPAEYNSLVISALDKYSEAKQFSSEGDWVNYGKAMEEFESILEEIRYDINYPEEEKEE
ncbi:MAG: UPF0182 family protein [Clostridia bacterium]|nr:UPF0182 family protein [Clostridia bacterium]